MIGRKDITNLELAEDSSINNLIAKLCENIVNDSFNRKHTCHQYRCFNHLIQQEKITKHMKRKAYEILLKFSKIDVSTSSGLSDLSPIDYILAHIYNLRITRQFDKANQLETLLNRLKDNDNYTPDNIKMNLQFLVCLMESGENKHNDLANNLHIPKSTFEKDEVNVLPLEPLHYGDTRYYRKNSFYMHYPKEIFEIEMTVSDDQFVNENTALFECYPGFDKNGNYLFNIPSFSSGKYEKQPFMGALCHPEKITSKSTLDLPLDIPDLKEKYFNETEILKNVSLPTVKKQEKLNILSEDEGFNETDSPLSFHSGLSCYNDIWEIALKSDQRDYFSWETVGCSNIMKEKAFITEAGPRATEMIHQVHLYELYLMDPTFSVVPTITVTHKSLIRDVFYLLIGVPSKTFLYMKEQMMFTVKAGIHLAGLTPGCTAKLLERFVDSGTEYCRLEKFATEISSNVCYNKGLVMQAFKGGLQQYLHYYQAMVLYLSQYDFTVLQLDQTFGKLFRQLSYIAKLCKCSSSSNVSSQVFFPQGLDLLSYLYQHAYESWGQEHGVVVVFLLKSACTPYLRYLTQWMFEGVCNDPYNEFHIEVNDMYINTRDEMYWTKRFIWKIPDASTDSIPLFLTDIAKHIFICGKSLNLLKLCCSQHHMCHTQEFAPTLILSTSNEMAEHNKKLSEEYKLKMTKIFEEEKQTKQKIAALKEQDRLKILNKCHQRIKQYTEKIKRSQEEFLKEQLEKKQQQMRDIQSQIEDKEARQILEKEKLKEKEERLLDNNENEQAEIAREDIISEYQKLTNDATYKKNLTEWSTKRWKLQPERIDNLLKLENQERSLSTEKNKDKVETSNSDISPKRKSNSDQELSLSKTIENEICNESNDIQNTNETSAKDCEDKVNNPVYFSPVKSEKANNELKNQTEELLKDNKESYDEDLSNNNNVQSSKETNAVDTKSDPDSWKTALRENTTNAVLRFRGKNIHGHSSDSVIQNIIYNKTMQDESTKEVEKNERKENVILDDHLLLEKTVYEIPEKLHSYKKDFDMFDKTPMFDILMNIPKTKNSKINECMDDEKSTQYIPLPVLLNRSILPLIQTQIHLVNKSVVDFFMTDLRINNHFKALRNYYFFQDGEFGQMLSQLLFDKIAQCNAPAELLNPPTLNSILARAIASTIHADNPLADNLSFAVKFIPVVFPHNASSILNCLELRYKVSWPLNIVITDKCIDQYNLLFGLLLQVKRMLWLLNDIWYHLKTIERERKVRSSLQCRQLQLYRHEMQHFARVMQSYIASQVLQVTWNSFQTVLQNKVFNLDQLRDVHISYLKKAGFRCLLSKKAAPVMKIIQDIFNIVTKFRSQLFTASWQLNGQTKEMEHPSYPLLVTSYKIFKEYSSFLYRAWLYRAVGAPSAEEIGSKRIPTPLARILGNVRR
ncbi:gamma-tubulin complex component 6 isoform X2 [Centruroides vittatus]|uniref:gamma-tubulin complex component 6 isoform X2 n=1 Tax=Centruroides vittatus TaxID=120091 RepID=UPI003510AB80